MKRPFYQRYALLILMIICFWVPFGMRGARMGTMEMRNDVKDWLPDTFEETKELAEFRRHFNAEAFVMVSWDGCRGTLDDERFRLFVDQFFPEKSPSELAAALDARERAEHEAIKKNSESLAQLDSTEPESASDATEPRDPSPATAHRAAVAGEEPTAKPAYINESLNLYAREFHADKDGRDDDFVGNKLGLYFGGNYSQNWAGQNEKWLKGDRNQWYFIVPKTGNLYRWDEADTLVASCYRTVRRNIFDRKDTKATLVAGPGMGYGPEFYSEIDGQWYYQDPRRLEAALFKSVVTGPSVLSLLTEESPTKRRGAMAGDYEGAMKRLNGVLFGPDGEQTCLLVTLNDLARQNLHKSVGRGAMQRPRGKLFRMAERAGIETPDPPSILPVFLQPLIAKNVPKTGAPEIHLGGPPVDNVAIDEEGQITLAQLVWFSVVVGVTISWLSFRNLGLVMMLFFVGAISAVFSLSIVWWGGSSFDAVLMSMPSLVYVLGLSGAVHIANYYRDTVDKEGYPGNPGKALALGWKPCALAAITTALGLVSLANSEIVPIRKFGFFSAVGVVFTLVLLFTFLPAALVLWPPRNFQTRKKSEGWGVAEYVTAFWRQVGLFCVRRHGLVTVVCLFAMVLTALGLPRIKTSVQLLKLFDKKNKIIADYGWLEDKIGKLVPMELLIRVDPALMRASELNDDQESADPVPGAVDDKFQLSFLERMELAEQIRKRIDKQFGPGNGDITGTVMLASTFVPKLPGAGGGWRAAGARGAYTRRLAKYREDISQSDYFRIDADQSELWRVSLRLGALNDTDYGQFVEQIKKVVEPVLSSYRYRELILPGIDKGRGEKGFRGAKVLLLGAPLGKSRFSSQPVEGLSKSEVDADNTTPADEATEDAGEVSVVEQTRIFAKSLAFLMKNAALDYRDWHDPGFVLPEDFVARLDQYECVVVMADDPRYDMTAIRENAKFVVDARDAVFQPQNGSKTAKEWGRRISVSYTGLVPIVYKAQRTLLASLIRSTFGAFVAISVVMMILLRSPTAGIVSMLPNVFPVVLIFGIMGWSKQIFGTRILVDIGTMMTASVAMGVAVDDTIHFLTWFRRGLDQGLNRKSAIMLAYDRCATAMTQTTLIGGLGLAVFGFSTFAPTQRFGVLMLILMVCALIGDLIFLPAILAGPAGRVFSRRKRRATPPKEPTPSPTPSSTLLDESTDTTATTDNADAPHPADSTVPDVTKTGSATITYSKGPHYSQEKRARGKRPSSSHRIDPRR